MASAARLPALPARAKSLPLSREHLLATHMRSDSRATWRAASRLIIAEAMRDARALRLARRIMARMRDAVDAIETSALTHEVG